MKKTISYLLSSYGVILIILFIIYAGGLLSDLFIPSLLAATILNVVNIFLSLMLFEFSANKSNEIFLLLNLGGLGIRLLFLLLSILFIIKTLKVDLYEFILVFFVFYFIQLILEIKHFHNFKLKKTS